MLCLEFDEVEIRLIGLNAIIGALSLAGVSDWAAALTWAGPLAWVVLAVPGLSFGRC